MVCVSPHTRTLLIKCSFHKQENSTPIYKLHTLRLCFIYRILPLPPIFLPGSPCFILFNSVLWRLHLAVITSSSVFLHHVTSYVLEDVNRNPSSGRPNLYLRSFPYYFSQAQPWCFVRPKGNIVWIHVQQPVHEEFSQHAVFFFFLITVIGCLSPFSSSVSFQRTDLLSLRQEGKNIWPKCHVWSKSFFTYRLRSAVSSHWHWLKISSWEI